MPKLTVPAVEVHIGVGEKGVAVPEKIAIGPGCCCDCVALDASQGRAAMIEGNVLRVKYATYMSWK